MEQLYGMGIMNNVYGCLLKTDYIKFQYSDLSEKDVFQMLLKQMSTLPTKEFILTLSRICFEMFQNNNLFSENYEIVLWGIAKHLKHCTHISLINIFLQHIQFVEFISMFFF